MRGVSGIIVACSVTALLAVLLAIAVPAQTPLVIGYVTKSATNQGWVLINKGAEDAAKAANVRLIIAGPTGQGALAGQVYAIERVISEGAKAIAIAPVDSTGVIPIVQRATARGVPFVAVDTAIDDASAKSYVGTDNIAAARAQAEWVASAIGDADEIILVDGSLSQSTGRERRRGFIDRLRELKPNAVVREVYTDWNSDQAETGVTQELKAHPNVAAIANAWDDGTLGSVAALRSLQYEKGKVRVIGFDGAPNALQLLKTGWIQADVAQMLYRQGYEGIKTAIAAAKGGPVPPRVDTGHEIVTAENLDRFVVENKLTGFMP
ncbi:MAG: sugar ABC transporter substrate-binding protein [Acetobacteraceae bacterium]|nr:sugar ABC transporter substrate-binding protein [Acetobacteraceae bacterium]MBV8521367.1 sugar ABC transporter substrate-binding protein [Acetobacteraceae bacterium]